MGPDKQTDGAAFEKEIADLFAVDGPEAPAEDDAVEDEKEDESGQ